MRMYKAIAQVQLTHKTIRCESGIWDDPKKAQEELRYFVTKVTPTGESYKVVQILKTILS